MTDQGTLLQLNARQNPNALDEERLRLENNFAEFVEKAWPSVDAAEYQPNWAIDALCEHLAAVTEGSISRLLINFPPRCGKTNVTSVIWPAWVWARREQSFRSGPAVKFLCGSYGHTLALSSSNLMRRPAQSLDLHLSADAITKRLSDMTDAELAALEARMIATPRFRLRLAHTERY